MCARYTLTRTELGGVVEELGADIDPSAAAIRLPRFNVGPSQICVIAREEARGDGEVRPVLTAATWGLRLGRQVVVNVRSETAGTRRPGLRRCVVPTDGFYEWTGEKGHKRAIWFHRPGGELVLLAGLVGEGEGEGALPRFAVLTAAAQSPVKEIHDRMPVVLTGGPGTPEMYCPHCASGLWLDDSGEARCPGGAAFSRFVTSALAELQPVTDQLDVTAGSPGRWFCPACGDVMVSAAEGWTCAGCRRRLGLPLLHQILECNPHSPYPPKTALTGALIAYWITRLPSGPPVGVTGFSLDDALEIARRAGYEVSSSFRVADNVRAEDLDPRHVLPNAGPLVVRGVWYPLTSVGAGTRR
jgi:putative SOS response-associated peptidase YedK